VDGQALVSQHIGDLEHFECLQAFRETISDLIAMYELDWEDLIVAHDFHPQYRSTMHALELPAAERRPVQHHRAHIASVLAEREAWEKRVLGVSFDGTGYGDDGSIWGGEIFAGSVGQGFDRVARLRPALLPGGDAAAKCPLQAAAGFLAQVEPSPDLRSPRYERAVALVRKRLRTFTTTSVGRLFDTAAALLGFTRDVTFEGQAAMWVEHLARASFCADAYSFPFSGEELDFRPLLSGLLQDRRRNRAPADCARAFQRGVAQGLCAAISELCDAYALDTVVLSGGVFQNELLLEDVRSLLGGGRIGVWTNHAVPPNDGGVSLGQAALAAFSLPCTNSR
jgi:hydrogenase maturation protein HypF